MNVRPRDRSATWGSGRCTRRVFLSSVLLGLTAGALGSNRYAAAVNAAGPCPEPKWLRKMIADRQAAARLGRAYLAAHPRYQRCQTLIADIERRLQGVVESALVKRDVEQIADALQRLLVADYTDGDVVSVAGWVLSKTEAQLYALTAMNL